MKTGAKNRKGKTAQKLSTKALMEGPCSDCGGQVRRKAISQEYEREGIVVKISGFKAWACSRCGEIYFEPGASDRLVHAVNSLFELARSGNHHKGKLRAAVSYHPNASASVVADASPLRNIRS